ncbi:MAG: hypothetical protein R2800_15395 [Flavipsychrobacter sp.]
MDIQIIKERYQSMSNDELLRIITQDAKGLTPEAIEIIHHELDKRGIDKTITKAITQQNYSRAELLKFCDILSHTTCPICEESVTPLKAALVATTIGLLVVTYHKTYLKVGCEKCLNRETNIAIVTSLLMGWWSRRGFIKTPLSIAINIKSKRFIKQEEHNDYMFMFVDHYIQHIEKGQQDKKILSAIAGKRLIQHYGEILEEEKEN